MTSISKRQRQSLLPPNRLLGTFTGQTRSNCWQLLIPVLAQSKFTIPVCKVLLAHFE
jgi:hypothetical protein